MELIHLSGNLSVTCEYTAPGIAAAVAERIDPEHASRLDVPDGSLVVLHVRDGSALTLGREGTRYVVPDRHLFVSHEANLQINGSPGTQILIAVLSAEMCTAMLGPNAEISQGARPLGQAWTLVREFVPLLSQTLTLIALAIHRPVGLDLAQHADIHDEGTRRVIELLRAHERPGLKEAADLAGFSHFHFSRRFKDLTGYGYHEYIDRMRTGRALEQIAQVATATELAAETGFSSVKTLCESVRDYTGLDPGQIIA